MISMRAAIINPLLSMRAQSPCLPVHSAARWSFFRLLAATAACVAVVCPYAPARADIQEPIQAHTKGERLQRRGEENPRTPATGSAQQVQIHQGETIDIVLRAHGQSGKTLEFTIRTQPSHGTLEGPPRQLTRNTASVTYVHRAEDGPGDDSFSFAVQADGSAMSAAVPVTVAVLDVPPNVVATPTELDFGAVKAGESTRRDVLRWKIAAAARRPDASNRPRRGPWTARRNTVSAAVKRNRFRSCFNRPTGGRMPRARIFARTTDAACG